MPDDYDERQMFFERRTDKTIISKRFPSAPSGQMLRIATHIVQGDPGLAFAQVKDEVVLRQTPSGRYEIKATFVEDDRSVRTLTFQKYSKRTGPIEKQSFSFVGSEIATLLNFLAGLKTVPFDDGSKVHLPDDMLRDIILDQGQARRIFAKNAEVFLQLAQQEDLTRDLIAVGYRRKQLRYFERLLRDRQFFAAEQVRLDCKPEALWQQYFEANTWIFGYGLSYQFASKLDEGKLERIVRGRDLTGPGKRADALMKTRGIVSSLCFVEIKRDDTPLLGPSQYRSGAWPPSSELVGGVAQTQTTVHAAVEAIGDKLSVEDELGDPTGEILFSIEPRSCLVIGSLDEFKTENGVNTSKFRSFDLYRKNTWRPEILTFDELLHRARFIVEHEPADKEAVG
ncbi:Shedu immune nuclease family protein [Bradyrhizobium sp. 76]|uniref:Shedu immune nuclease family protein n=1 Tax=Bradyrhizobium sp. 76 TaxID=2782680 RepID=UPI001FFA1604